MDLETKREKEIAINGLACFVQALKGTCITIDLQNESSVTGIAKEIDGYMNILLEEVIYEDSEETCYNYETLYVKGRNIRYIHIPKHLSVRETILKYLSKVQGKGGPRKTTAIQRFKESKLLQRHRETALLVEKIKQERLEASSSK